MTDFIDLKDGLIKRCLPALLRDKTTKKNIVFATDSYEDRGEPYRADKEITEELLPNMDLRPRILKSQEEQALRTRQKAEVFTPAWLCCKMNNHLDDEWFGRTDVFNRLTGEKWITTEGVIEFPKGKTWKNYVDSRRIEITCGEAPYIVSRYDAATGRDIYIKDRVGILDRKLRVVNENTQDEEQWLQWALRAFESVYGYEWQGDSLLIARINLLLTFMEYYEARWDYRPSDKVFLSVLSKVENVIVWNFWQMDGLTGTVPLGIPEEYQRVSKQLHLFDIGWDTDVQPELFFLGDDGPACRVFDWRSRCSMSYNSLTKG